MRARVGAMPQPKGVDGGRGGGSRVRVQSGITLEDLKRQTQYRLAQQEENESPDSACAVGASGVVGASSTVEPQQQQQTQPTTTMHYQHHPHHHQYPREPPGPPQQQHYHGLSPHNMPGNNNASQYSSQHRNQRDYGYGYDGSGGPAHNNYGSESRNYTDSQLGVGVGGGVGSGGNSNNMMPPAQFGSPSPHHSNYRPTPPPPQPLHQQQYSTTPRMPRHATVLKDRGSAENSVGSDPSGGSDSLNNYSSNYGGASSSGGPPGRGLKASPSPAALKGKNLSKAGGGPSSSSSNIQPKEMRSPDGRHTPVRERNFEGQVLFATPNQRREVPTTPYTEPPRNRTGNYRPHHQNMSPNYNRMRSPDHHHGGNYSKGGGGGGGGGGGYYNKNQPQSLNKQQAHHSKLPHGLTVQELKEMTRARLAAEADIGGPEGSSDQSVHSAGTQGSSKGSDQYSLGRNSSLAQSNESVTRNLVQSNESIRRGEYANQGQGFQGQHQPLQPMPPPNPPPYNYPRHPSPVFGAGGGPPPGQFNNGNQQPPGVPRQTSPALGLSSSQTRSQETWETASATSSTLAPEYHANQGAAAMPFSSPISDSNAMAFNRSRCYSAGATSTIPSSSFEKHQASYYDNVPLTGSGNRQRCATVSPPGMSRLHEDRPFLFSNDDKERLAIPPLSEPRLRLHSTGGLNTHGTAMRAFASSVSPPPNTGSGSAFVPISSKSNEQFLPQSPPPLNIDRTKFNVGDRAISTGSVASAHGDLPSSMAEAVLESIPSTTAPVVGGLAIGKSPFRASKQEMVGDSPFRGHLDSDNTASTFQLNSLLAESSGSVSMFSSGDSRNIFSAEKSSDRMLLGTHSWGGADDETSNTNMGLSHDFGNLLNLGDNYNGPAMRTRASTEPVWFGGNDPLLVSRIDPEHNADAKGPPRVSSLVDTNNAQMNDFNVHDQQGRT